MSKIEFDYSVLRGKIVEKFGTSAEFSRAIGISPASMSMKLTNKSSWTREEILAACKLLGIEVADMPRYFFSQKT